MVLSHCYVDTHYADVADRRPILRPRRRYHYFLLENGINRFRMSAVPRCSKANYAMPVNA